MTNTLTMEIVSMVQASDDIYVEEETVNGTVRDIYDAVRASAVQIAKDIEIFDQRRTLVEMNDDSPCAQVWLDDIIVAKVEAVSKY